MQRYSDRVEALVRSLPGSPTEDHLAVLQQQLDALAVTFERNARAMAKRVAKHSRGEAARLMNVSFRMSANRKAEEARFVDAFAQYQVQLLRGVGRAQVARIRKYQETGRPIADALWLARQRAQLIARTETHGLSVDVLAYWCQEAGSVEFIWVTARDEKVRKGHKRLDGKRFRWDSPPNTGRREGNNLPGHAPNCRCRALPVEALALDEQ